jgi:hypothetical protein
VLLAFAHRMRLGHSRLPACVDSRFTFAYNRDHDDRINHTD